MMRFGHAAKQYSVTYGRPPRGQDPSRNGTQDRAAWCKPQAVSDICQRRDISASLRAGKLRLRKKSLILIAAAVLSISDACAWGDLGHKATALIAYRHLTPKARANLDALLASDTDTLTAADFASRATWADKYRNDHRETAAWHFIDIEIDHPDIDSACYGFPALGDAKPASEGPAQDCVVNKIDEFAAELKSPATAPAERLLALKFLIHFVGDIHQPLHAADHDDRGGNCIGLHSGSGRAHNLHAYWDVDVVEALGASAEHIADKLDGHVTTREMQLWTAGTPWDWAMESFEVARRDVYALASRPTCHAGGSVVLSGAYQVQAQQDAAALLLKSAIRLASMLNAALGA
jgi:S1/P1 Nuclease